MLKLSVCKGWEQCGYFISVHSSDLCCFIYIISVVLVQFCAYENINQTFGEEKEQFASGFAMMSVARC